MFQLLKIEWLKVKTYPTFWILLGLFALLLPMFNYEFSGGNVKGAQIMGQGFGFPSVWGLFCFWTSWFVLFIAFLIVILITNEHRFRTNRQNVIDGWTRLQSFHAKCLMILLLAVFTTVYAGAWCLIFGRIYSGSFDGATENMDRLFYLFLLSVNYYGFAAMIAIFIKRSGLAIGLFMLYCLIIENLLKWQFGEGINNFLPLQCSDELLPLAPLQQIMNMAGNVQNENTANTAIIMSIVYISIYYITSRMKLATTDL